MSGIETRPGGLSEKRFMLLCIFAFAAAAWIVTLPMGLRPASLTLGKEAVGGLPKEDFAFFLHALWWTPHALFELGQNPWFTPYLYAPEGQSFIYCTLTPLYGVVSAPVAYVLEPWVGHGVSVLIYNF